jgi:hypothetical protein
MLSELTWAQCFALFIGLLLVVGGIIGLTENDSFATGTDINGERLLVFEVNGWLNLLMLGIGAIGLLVAAFAGPARVFALVVGIVYVTIAVWGIIDRDSVADLLAVNRWDHLLHLGIGILGIEAASVSGPGKRYALTSR